MCGIAFGWVSVPVVFTEKKDLGNEKRQGTFGKGIEKKKNYFDLGLKV